MDQDQEGLEEGEISNDSGDGYIPLKRPANYSIVQPHPKFPVNLPSDNSEEELESSDSDSDSETKSKRRKPKIKLKPKIQQQNSDSKRKKYDIWSTRAQEDVLAETLISCDVTLKDRSRDVESYDYTLAPRCYNKEIKFSDNRVSDKVKRHSNKRTIGDRKNANFKQQRRFFSEGEDVKGKKRTLLDLTVDLNSTEEDIAKDIANKLYEEKEDLILRVVNILGKQKALDMFEETKQIETSGGMLIMNQTRRRTPGGVFLYMVRHGNITQEQKNQIFEEERQKNKQIIRSKQKEKNLKMKCKIAVSREKILPDLLTRAELLASQNPERKVKVETDEVPFVNPPPTPETDGHENSGDDTEGPTLANLNGNNLGDGSVRKIKTFDEDFLDISNTADMDLF